ncbi:MAG: hypothetical protein AVDCRST_MAG18-2476 [uncultured Thermomicrobiales bacterium]|uniref:Uncharacterized protein n=1 Tax=uncultured Thermomicrobiales bacterium TaxID=1645740 RepID=A0A6J4VCA2_9BACT|nr:MAG: hypothetical protein AVDCRST_MAG18-2476 [uncultured Thermomicrobiales bacterium]
MPRDPRTEDVALRGDLVVGPTGEGWSPRRRTQRSRAAPSDPPRRQSAPARGWAIGSCAVRLKQ